MEKKFRRREFLRWSAVAAAGTIASACAQQTPAPQPTSTNPPPTAAPAPVTLTIWHNWGPDDAKGAPLQSIFKDFMAANPNITIKDEVYVDADIPLKVETASAAKQEPDLAFVGPLGSPRSWTDNGITIPVDDLITKWGFAGKFKDNAISDYTWHGKLQAFPLEGGTWPIWWNTKVLKASGVDTVPTTTDQLLAMIPKVRAAGFDPAVASGADGMGQYLWTLIIQSGMTDKDAEKAFGTGDFTVPSVVKGIQLFTQLRDAGFFVKNVEGVDYANGNTLMLAGKIAMSHFGAWEFGDPAAADILPDIQLGGFPLPADSPHKLPVIYAGFTAKGIWVTPNGAEKLDAVKAFVQFIYQPQMMARFVEVAGMTPPLKDVPVDNSKLNPLFVQSLSFQVEPVESPDLFLPEKIFSTLATVSQEAFTMGNSADKIIADLNALYAANK